MLVTISAPTSLAVQRAIATGMTLVTLARADSALIVTDEQGMIEVELPQDAVATERATRTGVAL
jgi:hypothetical protein